MAGDQRVDRVAQPFQRVIGRRLVLAHQPAIADDIGEQYRGELALMGTGTAVGCSRRGHLTHREQRLIGNPFDPLRSAPIIPPRAFTGLEAVRGFRAIGEAVMAGHSGRWWFPVAFCAVLLLAAGPGRGEEARLAISGYDPVAYFTDGKPVPGQSELEFRWNNARWRFASVAHRDTFAGNPDHYAPQYDGYCALGVAVKTAHKDTVDPEAWAIVDGKLYLNHDRHWAEVWRE